MSIRRWGAIIAVVLAATASGCGTASTSDPGRGSATSSPHTTPSAEPRQAIERVDWRLAEPARGRELRLVVAVPSADVCGFFERADVSETAEAVRIETFVRRRLPGPGEGCPEHLGFEEITVTLDEPLEDRQLEGCDAPPEDSMYFTEQVPPEGCVQAVVAP